MPYVSCRYAPPPPPTGIVIDAQARVKGVDARILCTDDTGLIWELTEDSDVGDWKDFVANGGTVEPCAEEEPSE